MRNLNTKHRSITYDTIFWSSHARIVPAINGRRFIYKFTLFSAHFRFFLLPPPLLEKRYCRDIIISDSANEPAIYINIYFLYAADSADVYVVPNGWRVFFDAFISFYHQSYGVYLQRR